VHSLALYRDLPNRDRGVRVPKEATWKIPEGKNPWKSSKPFAREELDGLVKAGVAAHKPVDFRPVAFSRKLVPAGNLGLPPRAAGSLGLYSRGVRNYYTWVAEAPASVQLRVKAGLGYGDRG